MGCIPGMKILNDQPINIGSYQVLKQSKLAEGAYGDIWKCIQVPSSTLLALKEIRLQSKQLKEMFQREVGVLQKIKSAGVRHAICFKASSVAKTQHYEVGRILMEFGTITLLDEVASKKLAPAEIVIILKEISLALGELHKNEIYHLDLKPQNVILVDGSYKLCDFGSAITKAIDYDALDRRQKSQFAQYLQANSTLSYRSPEMVQPHGKVIGEKSDIWMLGCIGYLLAYRKHPFENEGKLAIISGSVSYPSQDQLSSVIKSMLAVDPKDRPTAAELVLRLSSKER